MTLPEAAPKPDQSWIDDYPKETLEAMLEAGQEVLEWRRILNKSNDNVVGVVLTVGDLLIEVADEVGCRIAERNRRNQQPGEPVGQ